eukprot:6879844-Prymnesium_polylepis.1
MALMLSAKVISEGAAFTDATRAAHAVPSSSGGSSARMTVARADAVPRARGAPMRSAFTGTATRSARAHKVDVITERSWVTPRVVLPLGP